MKHRDRRGHNRRDNDLLTGVTLIAPQRRRRLSSSFKIYCVVLAVFYALMYAVAARSYGIGAVAFLVAGLFSGIVALIFLVGRKFTDADWMWAPNQSYPTFDPTRKNDE